MSRGALFSTLIATLDCDSSRLRACTDLLWSWNTLKPEMLRGVVLEGREYLAFEALIGLDIMRAAQNTREAYVVSENLDGFAKDAELVVEVLNGSGKNDRAAPSQFELAWTLPASLSPLVNLEPPPQSLAGLLRYTISQAHYRLIIVSPFLEQQGLEQLEPALKGAMDRGVEILLISHGLEYDQPGRQVFEYLRKRLPYVQCFIPTLSEKNNRHMLVHAKVIVADESYAVMSSANLTQYGLSTHLEIGIGLHEELATILATLFTKIIETGFVQPIS